MPLAKRVVSPVRLGRKRISEEDKFDRTVVCNNTLVGVLQQLSSLAYFADELFHELNQECLTVIRRTSRLVRKVERVESHIDHLDFKAVKIPAGDLKTYKGITDHYKTEYGLDTLLFAPTTRPDCVIDLYDASTLSPIQAIRQCNGFRKDGKTGSKLFSMAPVVREDALYGVDSEVDISSPLHHGDFDRKPREPKSVKQRPRSLSTLKELEAFSSQEDSRDGSRLEGAIANGNHKSAEMLPSSADLVPIDVTGTGFVRMCEYRESIRTNSREYIEECESRDSTLKKRRHRRRQTVSGIPLSGAGDISHGFIVQSENDLRIRSVSRDRLDQPKSMAYMDRYAPRGPQNSHSSRKSREELRREKEGTREEPGLARSCSFRRSMRSLFRGDKEKSKSVDLWVQGRPESPGPPMVDLDYPLRRSKSLPRSLKAMSKSFTRLIQSRSASTEGRLDSKSEDELERERGTRRKVNKGKSPKETNKNGNSMDQGFVTVVSKSKKPKSLRKNLTKRMSKSQSQMNQVVAGRPPLPLNFTPKHSPRQPKHNTYTSKSSGNLSRPKSLEFDLVAGSSNSRSPKQQHHSQQHHPIPVSTPLTPSSDGVFTPSPTGSTGAIGMKKHRLNIPPGQAWKAFGDIHYRGVRGGGGRLRGESGERQSSSGHWSATDSSVRYSTESDYPRSSSSTDRGSLQSADRDSAISFNMQDMHNITTDNNPEDDTSTVNGDTSMFLDDTSTVLGEDSDDTLNGSVVNAGMKVTTPTSENWVNSLSRTRDTKEMKDRRKKRRSRKDRSKGVTGSPGGLTMTNIKAHDGEAFVDRRRRQQRGGAGGGDEASSVYSQDTDGFYTSMHTDSGIKHSLDDLLNGLGARGLQGVTVPITLHNNNTQRSDSFKLATSGMEMMYNNKHQNPPPPPRRSSSTLSKDNRYPLTPSVHEDELDRILASTFSLSSSKSNDSSRGSCLSQSISETSLPPMDESLVSESDPELIYTRVKDKTSITTAGYPSLCSVTPLNSEDEDMLAFSREWRSGTVESVASSEAPTPTPESPGNLLPTSTPMLIDSNRPSLSMLYRLNKNPHPMLEISRESSGTERSLDESSMSWEFDISGMDLIDTSIYSTLPRKNVDAATPTQELESQNADSQPDPTKTEKTASFGAATYVPSLRMFNVGSLEDLPSVRQSLPQVKTPDKLLEDNMREISKFSNTFHIPSDHKFTFDTNSMMIPSLSPPQKQSSPARSKTSSSSIIHDTHTITKKPPMARKLDKSEAFQQETVMDQPMSPGMTGTWPRNKGSPCSPRFIDDSELNCSMSPTMENNALLDEKSWTNTFPRKKNKKQGQRQKPVPDSLVLNTSLDHGPLSPVQAKLIISSPISNQAEYVDNPHKRSLCSPVSETELVAFSQNFNQNNTPPKRIPAVLGRSLSHTTELSGNLVKKSSTMFEFSTPYENDTETSSAFRPLSKPLYPTLSSMKHSISFPEAVKEKVNPSNYNRTWYEGVAGDKEGSPTKSEVASVTEDRLSQTGYPFSMFLNDSFLCTLESSAENKRQSLVSNNSTNSSGSGKKSVSFASDLRLSQSSLNKSDTVSVSSTQTAGTDQSSHSKYSKGSVGGILTSFKKKSLESLKSNDSQRSGGHLNESVKLRSGKVVQVDTSKVSSLRRTSLKDHSANQNDDPLQHQVPNNLVKPEIQTTNSEKHLSLSPQKRSSAIFDDENSDVDMYTQVMQQQRSNLVKKSSAVSSEKMTRSRTDDLPQTGLSQNVKRQCTNASSKVKSPARSSSFKKNRLRRTPSKPSVRVRMAAADSCEVVNMGQCGSNFSPSKKGLDQQQPFSSIIMKTAPSMVTVTLPFDFNDQNQEEESISEIPGVEVDKVEPTVNMMKKPVVQHNPVPVKNVGNGRVVVNVQHLEDNKTDEQVNEAELIHDDSNDNIEELVPTAMPLIKREVSLSSFSTTGLDTKKHNSSSSSLKASVRETSASQNVQPVEVNIKQSAFTQVSQNKPIRPSPPKFVLPKLRSISGQSSTKDITEEVQKGGSVAASSKSVQRPTTGDTNANIDSGRMTQGDHNKLDNTEVPRCQENKKTARNMIHPSTKENAGIVSNQKNEPVKPKTWAITSTARKPPLSVDKKTVEVSQKDVMEDTSKYQPKTGGRKLLKSVSVSGVVDDDTSEKENRFVQGQKPPPSVSENKTGLRNTRPDSSYGSTTSLNYLGQGQGQNSQLGQANPLAKSLSNLSCLSLYRGDSTFSLAQSSYSLARSTDSLASNSSERAEKVKAAKLAFLQQQNENLRQPTRKVDERFAKHTLGTKKLSESRTSLSSKSCVSFSSTDNEGKEGSSNNGNNNNSGMKPLATVSQRLQDNQSNKGRTSNSNCNQRADDDISTERTAIVPLDKPPVSNNNRKTSPSNNNSDEKLNKRHSRHLVDNASSNPVPGKLISSLLNKFQN